MSKESMSSQKYSPELKPDAVGRVQNDTSWCSHVQLDGARCTCMQNQSTSGSYEARLPKRLRHTGPAIVTSNFPPHAWQYLFRRNPCCRVEPRPGDHSGSKALTAHSQFPLRMCLLVRFRRRRMCQRDPLEVSSKDRNVDGIAISVFRIQLLYPDSPAVD